MLFSGKDDFFLIGSKKTKEQLFYYKEFPILKELEQTNEKLMIEKNNLSLVTKLHMDLSNEIIKGNNLDTILEIVNERIQKPVVAEDIHHQHTIHSWVHSGIL